MQPSTLLCWQGLRICCKKWAPVLSYYWLKAEQHKHTPSPCRATVICCNHPTTTAHCCSLISYALEALHIENNPANKLSGTNSSGAAVVESCTHLTTCHFCFEEGPWRQPEVDMCHSGWHWVDWLHLKLTEDSRFTQLWKNSEVVFLCVPLTWSEALGMSCPHLATIHECSSKTHFTWSAGRHFGN